jgi:hypothetical protein
MKISRKELKQIIREHLDEGMFDFVPSLSAKKRKPAREPDISPEEKWNKAMDDLRNVINVLKRDERTSWEWNEKPTEMGQKAADLLDAMKAASKKDLEEVAPPGWEGTVKAMKDDKDVDNPYALSWWMKKKGYKSHEKDK